MGSSSRFTTAGESAGSGIPLLMLSCCGCEATVCQHRAIGGSYPHRAPSRWDPWQDFVLGLATVPVLLKTEAGRLRWGSSGLRAVPGFGLTTPFCKVIGIRNLNAQQRQISQRYAVVRCGRKQSCNGRFRKVFERIFRCFSCDSSFCYVQLKVIRVRSKKK